jgi:hypothetical protein
VLTSVTRRCEVGGIESPLGYRISCFIRLYAFPPVYVKRAALRKTDGSVLGAKAKKINPKSLIRKSKLRVIFSYQIVIVWVVIPCSFVGNTNNAVLSNNGVTQRYNTLVKRLERLNNDICTMIVWMVQVRGKIKIVCWGTDQSFKLNLRLKYQFVFNAHALIYVLCCT